MVGGRASGTGAWKPVRLRWAKAQSLESPTPQVRSVVLRNSSPPEAPEAPGAPVAPVSETPAVVVTPETAAPVAPVAQAPETASAPAALGSKWLDSECAKAPDAPTVPAVAATALAVTQAASPEAPEVGPATAVPSLVAPEPAPEAQWPLGWLRFLRRWRLQPPRQSRCRHRRLPQRQQTCHQLCPSGPHADRPPKPIESNSAFRCSQSWKRRRGKPTRRRITWRSWLTDGQND